MDPQVLPLRVLLRERRLELNIGQDEAARLCGVSQPAYGRWELGRRAPSDKHLGKIAEFLDISRGEAVLARAAAFVADPELEPDPEDLTNEDVRRRLLRLEAAVEALLEGTGRAGPEPPPAPAEAPDGPGTPPPGPAKRSTPRKRSPGNRRQGG